MPQPQSPLETVLEAGAVSSLTGAPLGRGVQAVTAVDLLSGRPLNPIEGIAVGAGVLEGGYSLLVCCAGFRKSREDTASWYKRNYCIQVSEQEECKVFAPQFNSFISRVGDLYSDAQIDTYTLNKLCKATKQLKEAFLKMENIENIEKACQDFEHETYVPILEGNILRRAYIEIRDALILAVKTAIVVAIVMSIATLIALGSLAAQGMFPGFGFAMACIYVPALFSATVAGGAYLVGRLFDKPSVDIGGERNEVTAAVRKAARASLS